MKEKPVALRRQVNPVHVELPASHVSYRGWWVKFSSLIIYNTYCNIQYTYPITAAVRRWAAPYVGLHSKKRRPILNEDDSVASQVFLFRVCGWAVACHRMFHCLFCRWTRDQRPELAPLFIHRSSHLRLAQPIHISCLTTLPLRTQLPADMYSFSPLFLRQFTAPSIPWRSLGFCRNVNGMC